MARNQTTRTIQDPGRLPRRGWALAVVLMGGMLGGGFTATAADRTAWLTGPALVRQLDQPVGVVWSGAPLRDSLERLSFSVARPRRLAVMLDRRVDPGQKLDLELNDVSLRDAIMQIAGHCDLGVSLFGPVVYLGPRHVTERMRTLVALRNEDVRQLPRRQQRIFTQLRPWRWDELTTPRALLASLETETGISIGGRARVPHDLWPAMDLPPLSLVDRLTLLGGAFDLTFRIAPNGRSVEWVPIVPPVFLERSYSYPQRGGRLPKGLVELVPQATLDIANDRLIVRGRLEDHEIVTDFLQGKLVGLAGRARNHAPPGEKVFTLVVEPQPVGPLVRQIARQLGLELTFNQAALEAAGVSLETVVSFDVQSVSLDQLLQAALEPAGMTFSRRGKAVEVRPAPATR